MEKDEAGSGDTIVIAMRKAVNFPDMRQSIL
jgi:hypothetical protein